MKILWIIVLLGFLAATGEAKRKRKFEGDFEFAEEVSHSFTDLKNNIAFDVIANGIIDVFMFECSILYCWHSSIIIISIIVKHIDILGYIMAMKYSNLGCSLLNEVNHFVLKTICTFAYDSVIC